MFAVHSNSLQHIALLDRCELIPTRASSNLISVLSQGLILTAVIKESILSTIALLAGVMRQVRAYVARSLILLCFSTPCQRLRESALIQLSANHSFSTPLHQINFSMFCLNYAFNFHEMSKSSNFPISV